MPTLQDTGLGWSALDSHLKSAAGVLGAISGFNGGVSPLPSVSAGGDAVAVGIHIAARTYGQRGPENLYIAAHDYSDMAVAIIDDGTSVNAFIVSPTPSAPLYAVRYYEGNGSTNIQSLTTSRTAQQGLYNTTVVFGNYASSFEITWVNPNIPTYSSVAEAQAAITYRATNFYKLNPGYAAGGFVRWIDLGGNTVTAPVLVSSVTEYADLSLDGSAIAPTQTVAGLRWQGMTFSMHLVTGYTGVIDAPGTQIGDFTAAFPNPIGLSTLFEAVATWAKIIVSSAPDPYGDDAQPGGGEGSPDENEEIDFSTPPTVGSYVGFFRMWNPTETELRQLASWMWSSAFDLDTFKRIFSAPIDAILGLSLVPVQPAGIGGYTIVLGGIDTQISAFTVTNRYVTLNCGSLAVDERWGAYLDYAPYTKMSIFLPYIGFRDISTDDVMGKTVELQYTVDVLSGACVAELKCGGSVLYSWQGNCAQQLPITSADWSNALSAALGLAGTAATAIVTGGGSLPLAGTVASATVNALSLKPRMERGGSVSGAAGAMAGQIPYLVRERPEQAVPGRQNHFIGYPSFTTVTLGSISGYTEVESIHLEGIPATAAELSELESILKEGFIL